MRTLLRLSTSFAAAAMIHLPVFGASGSVAEFDPQDAKSLNWTVVNDGVMGGLSKGKLSVSDNGVLNFKGNLSLENNGGFSSIRTGRVTMDFSEAKGIVLRVKGDGRTYQLRFNTDARFRGMEVSFMAEFETVEGQWTEVKVPFEDFSGSFRGMKLRKEQFDPSKISRVGLLLADKKPGAFELEVDWIRAYGGDSSGNGDDIVSLALADGRFKTLATALTKADLVGALQGDGPFTVFAPTDEAFAALPDGTLEALLKPENVSKLQAILKYHVVSGSVDLATALKAGEATSLQGADIKVAFEKGQVKVNGAALVDADLAGSNGVIHVIDSVILPPNPSNDITSVAERSGNFKTLLTAIEAAGLTKALSGDGPLTIFAPTDAAFAKLPQGTVEALLKPENRSSLQAILALHAVSGKVSAGDALNVGMAKSMGGELSFGVVDGLLQVNGVTITKTDIACDNGVIHVLDAVLLPQAATSSKASTSDTRAEALRIIEEAIDRGVPTFNDGDPAKCAQIYQKALSKLSRNKAIGAKLTTTIDEVLNAAGQTEDATESAWILRAGLDKVYATLEN